MTPSVQLRDRQALTRAAVTLVAMVGVLLVAHLFVVNPLRQEMRRLDQAIAQKQEDVAELLRLQRDYAHLRQRLTRAEQRLLPGGGASLLGTVEEVATRLQLRERIVHMRPQPEITTEGLRETSAELKLEALRLDAALRFLAALDEIPYLLRTKRFHLRSRFAEPALFDLSLTISAYEPAPRVMTGVEGTIRGPS
jgi:Tfp pilus assembly protein PilO